VVLAGWIACICEGAAEEAIMDILLDNACLVFSRDDLLEGRILRCRSAKHFEERYLRMAYEGRISVLRILDSRHEKFRLSKSYQHKVDVVNVVTAPEIEMLIVYTERAYEAFKKSGKKPSDFCKTNLRMHQVKSYAFVSHYFSNPYILIQAIQDHHRLAFIGKGEYTLFDLLRKEFQV
jgi:hypothetical protein